MAQEDDKAKRDLEYIQKLRSNEVTLPNEFTIGMGRLIKAAREEKGYSQSRLANRISRRQAMLSEIESGKIDIDVQTLVVFAIELNKPISYFIPDMTYLGGLYELNNKFEEEVLHIVRELEYSGDTALVIPFLKLLYDYYISDDLYRHDEK